MNRLTLGCFVFILLILGTTSVSSKEEYNIKNESKTYLNDSLKISAIVHDKKPSFVTITIENYGKKQISIGKVYGLLTYINNRWTYLTKAKNKFIKINKNRLLNSFNTGRNRFGTLHAYTGHCCGAGSQQWAWRRPRG